MADRKKLRRGSAVLFCRPFLTKIFLHSIMGRGKRGKGRTGVEQRQMRVSVRNLVEFILREGDIDNRHGGPGVDQEAMLAGGRIHRKTQGGKGSNYPGRGFSERGISTRGIRSDRGRPGRWGWMTEADGTGRRWMTIKGVYRDIHQMEKPDKLASGPGQMLCVSVRGTGEPGADAGADDLCESGDGGDPLFP